MGTLVLVCGCGQRLRLPGATPGRVGRCPKCRAQLRVPHGASTGSDHSSAEVEIGPSGYFMEDADRSRAKTRAPGALVDDGDAARGAGGGRRTGNPAAAGVSAARTDSTTAPAWLYPLQAPESLTVIAVLGVAFWIFTVLVPEYCRSVLSDAELLGATSMGRLIALISALPAVIVFLPVLFYALQYLGRVLIASAMGDKRPPRPPDRNFDGFLTGIGPWLVWLFLGAIVGFLPLVAYWLARGDAPFHPAVALGLGLIGAPYVLVALMMTFLHDDALAARPTAVIAALARLGPSFLATCVGIAVMIGLPWLMFLGTTALRASHFWVYVVLMLPCWLVAHWAAIVVMRMLGVAYYRRRKRLRWHRKRPRWGVAWGI